LNTYGEDKMKKYISSNRISITFYTLFIVGTFDHKMSFPRSNTEAQKSFLALCELLDPHFEEGNYCELYIYWVGDEKEERNKELDQIINLNNFDINNIQIYEKTLLVIKK
jgi:hypothetical protein